jgi:hypothetical protein
MDLNSVPAEPYDTISMSVLMGKLEENSSVALLSPACFYFYLCKKKTKA